MPTPIAYQLTDGAGAPLTTATPAWLAYVDRTGAARTRPAAPHHVGNGWYVFTPSTSDEATGLAYCIDNGANSVPARSFGSIPDSAQLAVMLFEDPVAGTVWSGAAATSVSMADFGGNVRSPPALVPLAGTYLYALSPSGADVVQGVSYRVDAPVGATPAFYQGNFGLISVPATPSTGMEPEALVVRALREYLLANLPSKVAQLNGLRNATLKSAFVEPFAITTGMTLSIGTTGRDGPWQAVTLPVGAAVTSSAVAAAITAANVPGLTAGTDGGRVVLQSTASPAIDAPSLVSLGPNTTGGPGVFGWDAGGEHVAVSGLVAPGWRGITDGWPVNVPDMGRSMWLIIGDRNTVMVDPNPKRNELLVTIDCTILKPETVTPHRNREPIASCVRAVRELLSTTDGRYLGRAGAGDVVMTNLTKAVIPGRPFQFKDSSGSIGAIFDAASFTLTVRVFQRAAS